MNTLKNFLYNVGYQIFIIIVPVILAPYLARVVGPQGIGTYSYTYSIVTLFGIFANLGLAKYGNREIAKCGNDREKRSLVFAELIAVKFVCSGIVIVLYLCYVRFFGGLYRDVLLIQIFNLLSFMLEISWLFWGMQEFRITTAVCCVMKLLSVFFIFAFVKTDADVNTYVLILALTAFFIQLSVWFFLPKYIDLKLFFRYIINRHWKQVLILFFPVFAKYLYSTMDRIMLGNFVDITQVGYYENVQSIAMTMIYVLTAMGDVVLPKMTVLYEMNETKSKDKYILCLFHLLSFLAFGAMFAFMGIADAFIPLFYGDQFGSCIRLLQMIAPAVLFAGYSDFLRSVFLLPRYRDREYVIALAAGAVVNFLVNLLLIPYFYSAGAVIGTVLAEFAVLAIQLWFIRKELKLLFWIKKGCVYLLLGSSILFVFRILNTFVTGNLAVVLLGVVLGGGIYTVCVYLYIYLAEKGTYEFLSRIIHRKKLTDRKNH